MSRPARRRGAAVAPLLLLAACGGPGGARLEAAWSSSDTALAAATWRAPAAARWCARDGTLLVTGIAGDTGVGVLVRAADLADGAFTVGEASPGAQVALRVLGPLDVRGYAGTGGRVTLEAGTRGVAGTAEAAIRLREGEIAGTLSVRFRGVPVDSGAEACPPAPGTPQTPGAGVP